VAIPRHRSTRKGGAGEPLLRAAALRRRGSICYKHMTHACFLLFGSLPFTYLSIAYGI